MLAGLMASSTGASALFLAPEFDLKDLFCTSAGSASASDAAPSSTASSRSLHHADPSTRPAKRDWFPSILSVDDGSIDTSNPSSQLQRQEQPQQPPSIHNLSFLELLQDSPSSSDISQFLANPHDADGAQPAMYGAALRLSDVAAALGTTSPGTLIGRLLDEGSINVLQAGAGGPSTPPASAGGGGMQAASARVDAFPGGAGNLSYVDELIERSHSLQLPPFPVIWKGGGRKKGSRKAAATPASKKGGSAGRPLRRHMQTSTAQSSQDQLLFLQPQHEEQVDGDLMTAAGLNISDQKIGKDPVARREGHIHSERQRRRGMTHLYATLHSLLPEGKPKTDRCSVLTETMKYIRALRQHIEELNVQKAAMKSMPAPPPMLSSAARSTTRMIKSTDKANLETDAAAAITTDHDHEQVAAMVVEPSTDHTSSSTSSSSRFAATDSGHTDYHSDRSAKGLPQADIARAAADHDVAVRFFGGDAFITLRTLKRKGIWSGVLKVLDDQNVDVLNVTLSAATADTDFHCIHAKVPASTSELRSDDLHRILKALVAAQSSRIREVEHGVHT